MKDADHELPSPKSRNKDDDEDNEDDKHETPLLTEEETYNQQDTVD
jgi:hypothetical protein